jgi:two-component system, NarL family, nitrate/nitrite response regulator NarL
MGTSRTFVLADSQMLFVEGLAAVLTGRGHTVLGMATSVQALMNSVSLHLPQMCVVDTSLPDSAGSSVIGDLVARYPAMKIVVLTADGNETAMTRALEAGASGFVHKSRGLAVVLRVLESVAGGERMTALPSRHPHSRLLRYDEQSVRDLASFLTAREMDCLRLLAAGLDTTQMARRLGVSITTVRSHVQAVLTKLGARTRLEAASMAIRYGLVRVEPPAAPLLRHA